jgi:hypothetical protein
MSDTGVVDQNVDTALVGDGIDNLTELLAFGHVESVELRARAYVLDFGCDFLARTAVNVRHYDVRTLLRTTFRCLLSYARRRACDKYSLVL